MGKETLILALIVLIVCFVFILPAVTKKREEGFVTSGIAQYDALQNNRDGFAELTQKRYNRFSDTQDVTAGNFADATTDSEIDQVSTQLKNALQVSHMTPDPTSKTLQGVNPDVPPETLAPRNQVVGEARKCEALNSRANCASLDDPHYSNCGICVKDRRTLFKQENDYYKHGGLLLIPEERREAEEAQRGKRGPVQYTPTVGQCPPGHFFIDRQSCERKSNQLDCEEAGINGGFNNGLTSEKQAVVDKKCANVPVAGADSFIYDTKNRTFDVNLRVLTPTGTGMTKVWVYDTVMNRSGNFDQLGYAMSEKPGKSFVVRVKGVKEAKSVNIVIEQESPHRSASGRSEIFQYVFGNNTTTANFSYNQSRDSAKENCERIGARLATEAELKEARGVGAQACSCGWTQGMNGYPMQTFENRGWCGNNDTNTCSGWTSQGHSWCFGVKPPVTTNFTSMFTNVLPWFNSLTTTPASPPQESMPSVWSRWGDDYQAPFYRAVVMQWEHVDDPRRMAQSFEPSITAVNDMGPNTVSNDGLKSFKLLRRFGTFKSSTLVTNPRPTSDEPMLTNQFWIWSNLSTNATVKFTSAIPGTFMTPVYEEDNTKARRGQIIANKDTFKLMQVSPCLKDGQLPGAYSQPCLSNLFASAGGDLAMGKLASMGLVDPYTGDSGDVLKWARITANAPKDLPNTLTMGKGLNDLNALGDMDTISYFLTTLFYIATTGRDATGNKVGGLTGKARALAINRAAQWIFGFDLTSPCEDVEEDSQGNIVIVPRSGALDADCLQWLWQNAGTDVNRGSEDPSRFAYPRRGGITATYVRIQDRFSGLRNNESTPNKREQSPFQTCQPNGGWSPVDAAGRPNNKNISMANALGGIKKVQDFYDSLHQKANYSPSSTDSAKMKEHADAVVACYGTQKAMDVSKRDSCGVPARYIMIIPSTIYNAWDWGNLCLMLPQVEVFDADGNEVAKGRRATASSNWPGTNPGMAVDGKNYPHSHGEGEYHDSCNGPDTQYWSVDLGTTREISSVKVYFRTDCCAQRQLGMPIQLRDASNRIVAQKHTGQGEFPDGWANMVWTVRFTQEDVKPAFTMRDIVPGAVVTLVSAVSWDRILRHSGFAGWVHGPDQGTNNGYSDTQRRDASFRIRPANNGKSGFVSFESVNFPNWFLRHSGFRIWLHWSDGSAIYKDDSSFKPVTALNGDPNMVSFQSSNYPDRHIAAHRDAKDQAWIMTTNNTNWDNVHHSWRVVSAYANA